MRALAIAALVLACIPLTCCYTSAVEVQRRTVIRVVVEKCLEQRPPALPLPTGDEALDDARKLDVYPSLELWIKLYAIPSCFE